MRLLAVYIFVAASKSLLYFIDSMNTSILLGLPHLDTISISGPKIFVKISLLLRIRILTYKMIIPNNLINSFFNLLLQTNSSH